MKPLKESLDMEQPLLEGSGEGRVLLVPFLHHYLLGQDTTPVKAKFALV